MARNRSGLSARCGPESRAPPKPGGSRSLPFSLSPFRHRPMIFLAQISDIAPDWLRNMAIFVACAAATAFYIKGLFNSKQKREITFADSYATKQEFHQHVTDNRAAHEQIFSK